MKSSMGTCLISIARAAAACSSWRASSAETRFRSSWFCASERASVSASCRARMSSGRRAEDDKRTRPRGSRDRD
eukprot:916742-Pyramimonas_sp.AAC.1